MADLTVLPALLGVGTVSFKAGSEWPTLNRLLGLAAALRARTGQPRLEALTWLVRGVSWLAGRLGDEVVAPGSGPLAARPLAARPLAAARRGAQRPAQPPAQPAAGRRGQALSSSPTTWSGGSRSRSPCTTPGRRSASASGVWVPAPARYGAATRPASRLPVANSAAAAVSSPLRWVSSCMPR
jgi:hypothetical protein